MPRANQTIYRGMGSNQCDLKKALMAMFGHIYAGVETKNLTAFKYYLYNGSNPVNVNLNYRNFISDLNSKRGQVETLEEAKILAIEIMDKKLSELTDYEKRNNYVYYKSGSFQDWSSDLVFGSVYYGVSNDYGDVILAYKDINKRGLDLNWVNKASPWQLDLGEYVLPIEVRPEEIIGFQQISLDESFFKVNFKGEDFVLVFNTSTCLDINEQDQMVYSCSYTQYGKSYNLPSNLFLPSKTLDYSVKPKAILSICDKRKCELPKDLIEKYNPTSEQLLPKTLALIRSINIDDKNIVVYE